MSKYKTPGVYVEEISVFPPSVAQVETAIPAFIGYTQKAEKDGDTITEPLRISSLLEYEAYFGKAENEMNITVTINDVIDSVTSEVTQRNISVAMGTVQVYNLYYAMRMYFANGGGPCYVSSVGSSSVPDAISITNYRAGLAAIRAVDEPTMLVFPDAIGLNTAGTYYTLINEALVQCQELGDRVAIIDMHGDDSANLRNSTTLGSDIEYLKYGAAYHPFLKTSINYLYDDADVTLAHSTVDETGTNGTGSFDTDTLDLLADSSSGSFDLGAYNQIKLEIEKKTVTLPPSAAMAGIYARVDEQRGVWKAPANVSVSSALEPTVKITHEQQKDLNVTTTGKSINAIRTFTGRGILVWGARTLAGNDNEWKYVPVRRFFNMVEESVKKATEQFVFEPNDANTWIKVRAMIENFLTLQWRDGALQGAKAEQAFFVRVGLGETMTAQDILDGRMNVEIGMAVVRPAEFIILKFSHKMAEA